MESSSKRMVLLVIVIRAPAKALTLSFSRKESTELEQSYIRNQEEDLLLMVTDNHHPLK